LKSEPLEPDSFGRQTAMRRCAHSAARGSAGAGEGAAGRGQADEIFEQGRLLLGREGVSVR